MSKPLQSISGEVTDAVIDSLKLLKQAQLDPQAYAPGNSPPLPSLLDRCARYASAQPGSNPEPLRLLHHFACTGGTLITKCLACVPNLQVLSEVDPLSPLTPSGGRFVPGDITRLAECSNRPPTSEEKVELFMASFRVLYQLNYEKGIRLLIREHSHSYFCTGPEIPQRPTVAEILGAHFEICSIVTVRHPVDSYLALLNNKWIHFTPDTVNEYAVRYDAFLDKYAEESVFRYEDFVADPDATLRSICEILKLSFPEAYRELFKVHTFSGDSGRREGGIEPRSRRAMPNEVLRSMQQSTSFVGLCERMSYSAP